MANFYSVQDIGNIVRKARKAQNLTQEDLAGLSQVGRGFISDLESGKETAQIGKMLKVLAALGVSLTSKSAWMDESL
ncbi:MAG: helix-turn-helix transcriptional regulator [Bdellovibrionales bacterium]